MGWVHVFQAWDPCQGLLQARTAWLCRCAACHSVIITVMMQCSSHHWPDWISHTPPLPLQCIGFPIMGIGISCGSLHLSCKAQGKGHAHVCSPCTASALHGPRGHLHAWLPLLSGGYAIPVTALHGHPCHSPPLPCYCRYCQGGMTYPSLDPWRRCPLMQGRPPNLPPSLPASLPPSLPACLPP